MDDTGDYLQVTVQVAAAQTYTLTIGFNSPYGTKYNTVYVNGSSIGQQTFNQSSGFTTLPITGVALNAGDNTIRIQKDGSDWGWIDIDYIQVQ